MEIDASHLKTAGRVMMANGFWWAALNFGL